MMDSLFFDTLAPSVYFKALEGNSVG